MDEIITKELRGSTTPELDAQWKRLRAELIRYEAVLYKLRIVSAAYMARAHGIGVGESNYLDLIFFDTTRTQIIVPQYGFRRAVALAARHAESSGNDREVGRAILLLSHHAGLRLNFKVRQ